MVNGTAARNNEHVVLGVCTYQRPQMLERCMISISQLLEPQGIRLSVVIVDNEPVPAVHHLVQRFAGNGMPFLYVHEPRRGIACARNAVLDKATELNAEWIAFMDDDEWAEPDWIAALMAPEYRDTPILLGAIIHEHPEPAPFWMPGKRQARGVKPKGIEGELRKTGTTGNVRLSADLIRAGFRFDETLGLMGGEDNELFTRARKAGFEIRRTFRAIVTEAAHPERATYMGQMYRAYWCAASDMRRAAISRGWLGAVARKAHTVPFNIAFGMIELATSPLFSAGGVDAFRRRAVAGGKKISKGLGRAAAMLGRLPEPYRTIHGG